MLPQTKSLFSVCASAKKSCCKRPAGCYLLIKEQHCAPFCMLLLQSLPGRKHAMISLGQLICCLYQWGNRQGHLETPSAVFNFLARSAIASKEG